MMAPNRFSQFSFVAFTGLLLCACQTNPDRPFTAAESNSDFRQMAAVIMKEYAEVANCAFVSADYMTASEDYAGKIFAECHFDDSFTMIHSKRIPSFSFSGVERKTEFEGPYVGRSVVMDASSNKATIGWWNLAYNGESYPSVLFAQKWHFRKEGGSWTLRNVESIPRPIKVNLKDFRKAEIAPRLD